MNQRTDGFESVVVGRPNTLAVAIAKQVTKGPVRKRSNPFVIEGECGFGKTTILDAIAAGVVAMKDGRKVIHVTGDEYLQEYVEALRDNKVDAFRKRYKAGDVLLLDQFEVVKKCRMMCDEFLHILDFRMKNKKQTVVATSVGLDSLQYKECAAEIVGRLMSGIVVRLGRPDKRMRMAAIRKELRESGADLPDAVVESIANASRKNMWVVGGLLHRAMLARETVGR